ncbi:flagellar hook-associated protein FlgK [Sporomusa sphaeroides DSM 2875]|uniref:flagellar hook-associated protein FlgK n=1 Tax=Sporomusa sphaeroides TaxID=47679 RepID=UPI00202F5FC7|nr:flagellar hook-associated protein FlgK [Sporomusa sphaeroides DSM 2875]
MNSTWTGLSISSRGLSASSAALLVTSNNISNVNTAGYSRQEVKQVAVTPAAIYNGKYIIGAGAEVEAVMRVRSFRLDQKYWQNNSSLGEIQAKADRLTEVETAFGETEDISAFTTAINSFSSALEDLSTDPSSSSSRVALQQAGVELCEYLNTTSASLTQLRQDSNNEVKITVEQINSYAKQIAALNEQIRVSAAGGASANDLEDQRTLLIDKLSGLIDVNVTQTAVGKLADGSDDLVLSITVNGETLVNNGMARNLECYEITDGSNQDGMYGIRWQDTGTSFTPDSGELKAYLDLRDGTGEGSAYKGIPYYINQLNQFAQTLAKAFNEGIFADGTSYYSGHAGGVGLDGSTGTRFFSYDGLSTADLLAGGTDTTGIYANITAANISLSAEVLADVDTIAAASAAGGAENSENLRDLIDLLADSKMFNTGTPLEFMNSIIATVGTGSEYMQTMASKQSSLVNTIDTRRASISGVSTNEETANLTKYQEAYNASAIMVSTWSEIYATTINMVSSD